MARWQLASYNVALARGPADSPEMVDFYPRVPEVNAAAERSPGYVWRLEEDGSPRADGTFLLENLSVWESVDALRSFTYRDGHLAVFRDRSRWFHKSGQPGAVLWWVSAGHRPDFAEGAEKLERLRAAGASHEAFDFAHPYAPPER
jgi:hypothetical protein